ncbi:MAG: FAD-dependent oxidoreductase [Clostridia bacterium]|nr:FAD-dependent oxidoreductase [Clostridia bacterium]
MQAEHKTVVIIGGGPAGLAAAVALFDAGVQDILILEREKRLGGILNQCIHDGFGLTRFGETLSGPEYAGRFIDAVQERKIECITDCTVIKLTKDKEIHAATKEGLRVFSADAVLLTMGCRERPRGGLSTPGDRPAGVFTAGVAQSYMNLRNTMVGKRVVILGSGDIGMIMARRMTLEGAKVEAVFEILPYPSGLPRNIEQCLNDYGIPLFLSHTVTRINGRGRLSSVTVSEVGADMKPIPGTEKEWPCDTLILSCGLIPENELSLQAGVELDPRTKGAVVDENQMTSVPGIFAAGNVLHVHDLVDFVSLEAEKLAESVKGYLANTAEPCGIEVQTDATIGYTVPQRISGTRDVTVSFRPRKPMQNCHFEIWQGETLLAKKFARKALPAVMMHVDIPAIKFVSKEPVKVVSRVD